ncbi:lipoprotein intramolecular transacylase Lit [Arthrobacter tumbae]|uniref:lipoprotein intramolecular transacylase Lit n=1 Tax=Arthrobacter tumbae TaxID=163874 RepID=UPI0027DD098E|nr:DUF1461 domain-containing protein [Arthrobacter tumbae]MBM7782507.1 integral membrane protein (TIGR01906 family) [Arthrobacter tumbae]
MADKAENENQSGPEGSERRAALRSDQSGGGSTRLRESGFPMRKASTLPDVSAYTPAYENETDNDTEAEIAAAPTPVGDSAATSPGSGDSPAVPEPENTSTGQKDPITMGSGYGRAVYSPPDHPTTDPSSPATQQIAAIPVKATSDEGPAAATAEHAAYEHATAGDAARPDSATAGDAAPVDATPDDATRPAAATGEDATPDDAVHEDAAREHATAEAAAHEDAAPEDATPVHATPAGSTLARSSSSPSRPSRTKTDDDATPDTSSLAIRPPEEEVNRRANQRDEAAAAKPLLPRVLQAAVAVFFPIILLAAAVRAVTTPLFLWVEYHRPGFPADSYGFSTEDRMTYGSYAMDYILNWAPARFLGDLVNTDGDQLFLDSEVGHMADVKGVLSTGFVVATVLAILTIVACIYLARRYPGGIRRGLFAGAVATLVLAIALAVAGILAWETFFTQVHALLFADGTWTFRLDDTLIRLFPAQFWIDAAASVGAIVLIGAVLTLVLTWPTKARREKSAHAYAARRANNGI